MSDPLDGFAAEYPRAQPPAAATARTGRLRPAATACLIAIGCITIQPGQLKAAEQSAQGETWQSIEKLPDWSGVFSLDRAGHEFAGRESRSDDGGLVPLTPQYRRLRQQAEHTDVQPNLAACLPAGIPGVMLHTMLSEWLFTPGRVTVLFEDGEVRRIHTDRNVHLPLPDLEDSYMGDSIGHWEGKTLVVDTVGFPNGELFQNGGLRAMLNTHYVERIFLRDKNHLEIDSVIDDPRIFAKPYAATRIFERENMRMQEPMCAQSSRDHGDTVDLTPPAE